MRTIKCLCALLLAMVAGMTNAYAQDYDFEADGFYYNILPDEDNAVEVTNVYGNYYSGEVAIPAEVSYEGNTYRVTTIGSAAFNLCTSLTSVEMPSVKTISFMAFADCYGLVSVSMPSVETIEERAFVSCSKLESIHLPASCTNIVENPFTLCGELEEITVDENNPNYASVDGALYDKGKTTLICCPMTKSAIDMPSSVTTIIDEALCQCYNLTSVSMPSVKTIGREAFYNCSALTTVDMPSVVTIGESAFDSCNGLTSVTMPVVETIGEYAFGFCSGLTSITIPSTTTTIESLAFGGCYSLYDIKVDEANSHFTAADGILYDKEKTALLACPAFRTSVSIPASVTTIGSGAFAMNSSLQSVSMPSVVTVDDWAFSECTSLKSIEMPSVKTIGKSAFDGNSFMESVKMPVAEAIGPQAFYGCSSLSSVEMPSAKTIGNQAFCDCTNLSSVSMPVAETIGDYAFEYCESLMSVDIPGSVTAIGIYAFVRCTSLSEVYCHWQEPLQCDPGFDNEVYELATLYVPRGTKGVYGSVAPWSNFAKIVERDYSGLDDATVSDLEIRVIDGTIVIGGTGMASAPTVEVYSTGGECVYRGAESSISGLPHGVYVVKVGGTTCKVAL